MPLSEVLTIHGSIYIVNDCFIVNKNWQQLQFNYV